MGQTVNKKQALRKLNTLVSGLRKRLKLEQQLEDLELKREQLEDALDKVTLKLCETARRDQKNPGHSPEELLEASLLETAHRFLEEDSRFSALRLASDCTELFVEEGQLIFDVLLYQVSPTHGESLLSMYYSELVDALQNALLDFGFEFSYAEQWEARMANLSLRSRIPGALGLTYVRDET